MESVATRPASATPDSNQSPGATQPQQPNFGRLPELANNLGKLLEGAAPPAAPKPAAKPGPQVVRVHPEVLEETLSVSMLGLVIGKIMKETVDPLVVHQLLQKMIDEVGVRGDPLGTIFAEQILLLRLVSGNLHAGTLLSSTTESKAMINSAALNATAELRRTMLALAAYRASVGLSRAKPDPKANPTDEAAAAGKPVGKTSSSN
jgi:hypothetical protein